MTFRGTANNLVLLKEKSLVRDIGRKLNLELRSREMTFFVI